jgi:tetratricopeptide (TPR) repeat protein
MAETLLRKGASIGTPEFKEAVACAETAVRIESDFALARDVLTRLYLQAGRVDDAIKQSRLAVSEDPSDQTAVYHLILSLRKAQRTAEVPELSKKLAALREQARAKEIEAQKYAIVEVKPTQ